MNDFPCCAPKPMTSPLDRLRAALNVADDKAWPMTWLYTKDLAWALQQLDKEQAMNDNDVDDLTRLLAGHRLFVRDGVECQCGAEFSGWQNAHRHAAAAVLASGVVVSSRDVKALADHWAYSASTLRLSERWSEAGTFQQFADQMRSLLREPATDATHCTQCGNKPGDWARTSEWRESGMCATCLFGPAPATDAAVKGTSKLDTNSDATDAAPTGEQR